MSCYHPMVAFPTGSINIETGKQKYNIKPQYLKNHSYDEVLKNNGILIPCGNCLGCRLDYSRKWADRMLLELETAGKGIFLTLTYDNEHIHWSKFDEYGQPIFATLNKRDFQLFMKSLRKEFAKKDIKIKFFASGEYGPSTLRPHMHCIVFGIGLSDIDDCKPFGRNDLGQSYYISPKIQKIWNRGNILLSDVSYETCAYVARYILKKQNGYSKECYDKRNALPEFSLMSRKPGIGSKYLELHPDCLDYKNINISTPEGGRKITIPKFYLDKLELIDKEKYDKIKRERQKLASDKLLLELSKTDLGCAEYLANKEEERKKKASIVLSRKEGIIMK